MAHLPKENLVLVLITENLPIDLHAKGAHLDGSLVSG